MIINTHFIFFVAWLEQFSEIGFDANSHLPMSYYTYEAKRNYIHEHVLMYLQNFDKIFVELQIIWIALYQLNYHRLLVYIWIFIKKII